MAPFTTLAEFAARLADAPGPNEEAKAAARDRNQQLTKPPGALGRLEDLAIWVAGWQGTARPKLENPEIVVFAGNHGVAARAVSAFPAEVTQQMVANFESGGAAINQLAMTFGASMKVVALDLDAPTADFTQAPAMTEDECVAALRVGWEAVNPAADMFVAGEMGIGNTTAAAAIATALYGGDWVGRGTGVDDEGLARKREVVAAGVAAHGRAQPLDVLRCLGGREMAAMAGAIAAARQSSIPVILDGFICSAAAATLTEAQPGALDHCLAGHVSAEGAHERLLKKLGKEALIDFGLRLGEGSGAALALGIIKGALACHSGMATFAEAGVSEGQSASAPSL
ncbi:MAG: nicotinate-nucleotide--dimethylbenzimidazole phosphoribosyltransferase [Pseudomonadota bacterium]